MSKIRLLCFLPAHLVYDHHRGSIGKKSVKFQGGKAQQDEMVGLGGKETDLYYTQLTVTCTERRKKYCQDL